MQSITLPFKVILLTKVSQPLVHILFLSPLLKIYVCILNGWADTSMDKITKKTPNLKCRLYWCLIEYIDWRYSQSCWYFRPLLWTSAPLTFLLVHLPSPLPSVNKYRLGLVWCLYSFLVCGFNSQPWQTGAL